MYRELTAEPAHAMLIDMKNMRSFIACEGGSVRASVLFVAVFLSGTAVLALLYYTFVAKLDDGSTDDDTSPQEQVAQPQGYVYFTAFSDEGRRAVPIVYDIEQASYIDLPNEAPWYYEQVLPPDRVSGYLVSPYFPGAHDHTVAHVDFSTLVIGDETIKPEVYMTGGLQRARNNEHFAFHGISRSFAENHSTEEIYDRNNYLYIQNWSVYYFDTETKEVREIENGVSPVWSPDGEVLYYLTGQSIMRRDLETGLTTRVGGLLPGAEEFFTSGARLALSSDGRTLYASFLSQSGLHDSLLIFRLDEVNGQNAQYVRQYELEPGSHFVMTISPDDRYAGFIVNRYRDNNSFTFRVLDLTQEFTLMQDLFTYDTMGYPLLTNPVWSSVAPSQ